MNDLKICGQCEISYSPNRSDQKFCSLKCRNKYGNKKVMAIYHQRKHEDVATRKMNLILIKNRAILKANCDKQLPIDSLTKLGFTLNSVTGFISQENTSPILLCYEYSYQFIDAKTIRIFKQ